MPHPFRWQPGGGQRHATLKIRPKGGFPANTRIDTLCGTQVTVDDSDVAWLWNTCQKCNLSAHELVGSPIAGRDAAPTG